MIAKKVPTSKLARAKGKAHKVRLAVNRVHPETEKLVTVNNGFDHEVAHRAIARIEHAQGWQREERGLFLIHARHYPRPRTLGMIPKAPVLDIFIGRDGEGACLGWTRCACSATWCNAPISFG